jgi:two-component system nitrogen regulation response regulator GlnG
VRELENTIQRASVLATADVLLPKDIPLGKVSTSASEPITNGSDGSVETAIESLFNAASTNSSIELLPWLEREFTLRAMHKTNNNQVRAAKLLGITRATLRKRLERNGALGVADDE